MALPTIPTPQFTIKKSKFLKQSITMRPFLVGEETILLQVKDSEDTNEIMGAIKQVINRCIEEPKNFNVDNAPSFILELMFLRLRQHSNGEVVELNYRCKNEVGESVCNHEFQTQLDLRDTDIHEQEGHTNTFDVGGGIGISLKYPTLALAESLTNPEDWVETIAKSIETVYSGDDVWLASDHTEDELMKFASGISSKTKAEIQEKFYNRIPTVRSVLKTKCPKCGHVHTIELNGLQDHFG